MTKDWYKVICLSDDLGLEFEFNDDRLCFYRQEKAFALLTKVGNKWVLSSAPMRFTCISKNPKKLVNLAASLG